MFALVLPFLAPLLTRLPSLATLKWIAGGILVLVMGLTGFALGYHWEESAFEAFKSKSATHELRLQKQYGQIGSELQAKYEAEQVASEAETQRQLQELHSGPKQLGRGDRGGHPVAGVSRVPAAGMGNHRGGDDSDRIIGVLRSAAGK